MKYYNGEKSNPYQIDDDRYGAWKIEMLFQDAEKKDAPILYECLSDYISYGLGDYRLSDNTPPPLKPFLFNRFCQYNGRVDVDAFKRWYEKLY